VGAPVCCNGRGDALLAGKGEEDGENGVERAAVWGGLWPKEVDVGVVGKGRRGALVSLPREGRRLQEDERTGRGLPPVWF